MKATAPLLGIFLLAQLAPLAQAAESKRTAEYLFANSAENEGKEVTLDVAFVKPAQWKSPIENLAFFQAMTIDRRDHKFGGNVLVAIPAEKSGDFAKKYGMDFDGRSDSDPLSGTMLAAPGKGGRGRVWLIDTTNQAADLIKAKKLELAEESAGRKGDRPRIERAKTVLRQ